MVEKSVDECLEYISELKKARYVAMTPERYGMLFLCLEAVLKEVKALGGRAEKHGSG